MWFSVAPESENKGLQYGFVSLDYEEAAIGSLANLLTFPLVFILVFLFKYSKTRVLRDNRILKALMNEDSDEESNDEDDSDDGDESDNDSDDNIDGSAPTRPSSNTSNVSSTTSKYPTKASESDNFFLPHYCIHIAWFLCFLFIGASIFFLWAYGITFGNDTTYKWLTSFIISFFTNFCIFEPLKVGLCLIMHLIIFILETVFVHGLCVSSLLQNGS